MHEVALGSLPHLKLNCVSTAVVDSDIHHKPRSDINKLSHSLLDDVQCTAGDCSLPRVELS